MPTDPEKKEEKKTEKTETEKTNKDSVKTRENRDPSLQPLYGEEVDMGGHQVEEVKEDVKVVNQEK